MAQIPTNRLLLETDSPYCDVRPSHAGKAHVTTSHQAKDKKKYDPEMLIKGRNDCFTKTRKCWSLGMAKLHKPSVVTASALHILLLARAYTFDA